MSIGGNVDTGSGERYISIRRTHMRKRLQLPKIIQIEVTTACQLRCMFCPHTIMAKDWVTTHMSWEAFSSLLPFVRHTKLVHLQGWGEPLLHPRLWDMAAAIRENRGRASVTTNALLLDTSAAREACRVGLELVAISVAGAHAETNDYLRVGSYFERICANIDYLCGLRPRPKVHLLMQMMKSNKEELPELVTLAAELGVDEVIAPNLDYIPTEEVDTLRAFARNARDSYLEITEEATRRGKELGIKVHIYPIEPRDDILMCDADPVHRVWISASGEVAPCPYLALSVRGRIPRLFWGKKEDISPLSFGNVLQGLDRVLNGQPALSFREAFSRRLLADRFSTIGKVKGSSLPRVSSSSIAFLESLAQMTHKEQSSMLPPPPDTCRNCYKLYGL
jgi:MoaA/NifB/PqqE/SkfB family radical SAM enzyme